MKKGQTRAARRIRLLRCDAAVSEVRTRIPFRYGKACLTVSPTLVVRVEIESENGGTAVGFASDCLPPGWFDKNPAKTYRENVDDQLTAYRKAREIYLLLGGQARTAHELWEEAYPRVQEETFASGLNALTASFGSSFLERALIDAICRVHKVSFFQALKDNLLGMETAPLLPKEPLKVVACRHTIGLGDPLTIGEIPKEERLDDGLPQALEEDIELYGLRNFKVKVAGNLEHDAERLIRMAALFSQRCPDGYRVSLDGNEQYKDLDDLRKLLARVREQPYGQEFFDNILFIEQPLSREVALMPEAASSISELSKEKPVIIDESDEQLDSFERALELGYRGTSHKNCKGIFRSLRNRAKILQLQEESGDASAYFQTAEDLVNLPVLPLQQDLATICALGITHAERNGHHFFRGLDHLPKAEAEAAWKNHGDLYEERQDALFLRVVDGAILCESIVDAIGYGYSSEIAFDERTPLDKWDFDQLG